MSEERNTAAKGGPPTDEQVAAWARTLSADPASPVFYDLARALLDRNAPKRAALVLKAALVHHSDDLLARLLLGEALLNSGRDRACTREMARVLGQSPGNIPAMKLLARALRYGGQREEARVILERARREAPHDEEVLALLADAAPPPAIQVRERDGSVTHLASDEDLDGGSLGSSVPFGTDPLAEPTMRDAPMTLEDAHQPAAPDLPEVFTASNRVPEAPDDYDDATRPMSVPPFDMALHTPPMVRVSDLPPADRIPSVQVSPSLALEAAELAAAGLIDAPRAQRLLGDDPASVSVDVGDLEPTGPIATRDLRPPPIAGRSTTADAPPSISHRSSSGIFDDMEPTAAQDAVFEKGQRPTAELTGRVVRLAMPDAALEPVLEPTKELSQTHLARPGASLAFADEARGDGSLDLPRFDWEMEEDRPSTVQIHGRRRSPSSEQRLPSSSGPPAIARVEEKPPRIVPPSVPPPRFAPRPVARPVPHTPATPARRAGPPSAPPPRVAPPSLPAPVRAAAPAPRSSRDLLDVPLDPSEFSDMPPKPAVPAHDMPDDLNSRPIKMTAGQPAEARARRAPPPPPKSTPPRRPPPPPKRPRNKRPAPRRRAAPPPAPAPRAMPVRAKTRTHPAPPGRRRAPRRWPLVVGGVAIAVLAVTVALLASHRASTRAAEDVVERAERALNDDTYLGRVNATEILVSGADAPGLLAKVADAITRAFGGVGLAGPEANRRSLLALVEAERVGRDAERDRMNRATDALTVARDLAPDALETRLADVRLRLHRRELEAAQAALDALPLRQRDTAPTQYLYALVARARGDRSRATDAAASARSNDAGYVPAQLLMLQLQDERGDSAGALQSLKVLGDRHRNHVGVYIAYQRLRVQAGAQADDAVSALRSVLERNGEVLSPNQRALIQDTIGLYHVRKGDIASARSAYATANETVPDDPRYSAGLARLDMMEYKLDAAEKVLREAARMHPSAPRFLVELARARLLRGDPSGALAELKRVSSPDIDALLLTARAQLALSDPSGALETLVVAERQDPALLDVDYYRLLAKVRAGVTPKAAVEQLEKTRTPAASGRLWDKALPDRAYGMALAQRGNLAGATEILAAAQARFPTDYRAAFELCQVQARRLKARDALKACRAAQAINPANLQVASLSAEIAEASLDAGAVIAALAPLGERTPEMTRRLARAYLRLDRLGDAEALAQGDTNSSDRYIRGMVLLRRGRGAEARPLLEVAAGELQSDAWVQIGYAELLLDQGDARKAARRYQAGSKLSPLPFAALGAARAAMRNNNWRQAFTDARIAERKARRSLSHPRLRGEALAIQGRVRLQSGRRSGQRQARRFFAEALKAEKELPAALVGQGLLAEQQQRIEDALRLFGRAIQVAPEDPEAHYLLGRLLLQTPETVAQGRELLARARTLDPRGRFGSLAKGLLK